MAKNFKLSQTDKKLGGVCGGLAAYFDIDPLIVRLGVVVLTLCRGVGLLGYILFWIFAPKN